MRARISAYRPVGKRIEPTNLWLLMVFALALNLVVTPRAAEAVLNAYSGAPTRETSTAALSPEELVAHELQGRFRNFLGTPIGQNHFLTAQHVGISVSDTITFDSGPNLGTYAIQSWTDDPSSDLRIVEITNAFSSWSLLYQVSNEIGQQVVVFGRGGPVGSTVTENSELKGWTAGPVDGLVSWGRNIVSNTFGATEIRIDFDENGLTYEAGLSSGDSGGAWFIIGVDNQPRLAGLTFRTSGPYQFDVLGSPDGLPFAAILFDRGGFWEGAVGSEVFLTNSPQNFSGFGFATRISDRVAWIATIVPITETDTDDDGVPDSLDNCDFVQNALQTDSGGIGFGSTPDQIGDSCQCGDVTGDGVVTSADAFFTKRYGLGLDPISFNSPGNCDVTGEGDCNGSDGGIIAAVSGGAPVAVFGQNCPNANVAP